jgi:hypothetical protein
MFEYRYRVEPKKMIRISTILNKSITFSYHIDATDTIKLFIVDDHELNKIRINQKFKYINSQKIGTVIDEAVTVTHAGKWHFLIYNPTDREVYFNYEIFA